MFIKPRSINFISFWSFHLHQPKTNIPFRLSKLYNRKDGGHRKWVFYCVKKKLYFAIYVFIMVMVLDHFPKDFLSGGMFMSDSVIMKKQ